MKILFVCMGNICRSPSAQGIFEKFIEINRLSNSIIVDSAGTHSYHVGSKPDSRSIHAALKRDIDISHQQARKISPKDFENFDYVVVMDNNNYTHLKMSFPKSFHHKLLKMMRFTTSSEFSEVPDPYYGGNKGFELVLDLLDDASTGLYNYIKTKRNSI